MVQYWKSKESAKAKVIHGKDGSLQMVIEGEKYPLPSFPRGHILSGPLAKLKHKVKNMVFNKAFEEIEKLAKENSVNMQPIEVCAPFIREMWRVFEKLENAEVVPDMKERIKLIKKVMCWFLQEDDAYRFRAQWFLENLDIGKVKLSKADKYYFRGKYFKVDHDQWDY